jgi:hypothetical protein
LDVWYCGMESWSFWTESLRRLIREVLRWMQGDLRTKVENDLVLVLVLARVLVLVLVFVFVFV